MKVLLTLKKGTFDLDSKRLRTITNEQDILLKNNYADVERRKKNEVKDLNKKRIESDKEMYN